MLASCTTTAPDTTSISPALIETGTWRFSLSLGANELPFNVHVYEDQGSLLADIINAEERITIKDIRRVGDSLYLRMPLFDSEFKGVISEGGTYSGVWANYDKGDYTLAFTATHNSHHRFCSHSDDQVPDGFQGKYKVSFSPGSEEDEYPAIGQFEASATNNRITGTFMTETGDYRYLEGNFCMGKLLLSCFDGSHAFRFEAEWKNGRLVNGVFQSGKHWQEPWVAIKDADAQLTDPHHLTSVIDTSAMNGLRFPGPKGSNYMIGAKENKGKVTILQVMGSWCPNCIDETLVFKEYYQKYHEKGLEIVPIAFESQREAEAAFEITERLRSRLELPYPIYYGGYRSKSEALERLPFLNKVISFPTSIVLDKTGNVRDVHTGFYGPGTKDYYSKYVEETEALIVSLLEE